MRTTRKSETKAAFTPDPSESRPACTMSVWQLFVFCLINFFLASDSLRKQSQVDKRKHFNKTTNHKIVEIVAQLFFQQLH